VARDALQTRWLSGRIPELRKLLFSPIKDVLLLPLWFDAIVNSRVQWRGHRFRVGRLTRLRQARVPRDVRRRVRRVRKYRTRNGNPAAGDQAAKDSSRLRDLGSRLRFWSEDSRNPRYPRESS
jgi:ceramide glucosyltransferase